MFSNESCKRLKAANFFNPTPDTFKATKKVRQHLAFHAYLCTAIGTVTFLHISPFPFPSLPPLSPLPPLPPLPPSSFPSLLSLPLSLPTHPPLQLCIALNDIEQVRRGIQELPEFISWSHFQEVLQEEASPERAAEADQVLKDTLSAMDQAILQELTSLTEHIAEKVWILFVGVVCVCM